MKVKELIEKLNNYVEEAEVIVRDPRCDHLQIQNVGLEYSTVAITPNYKKYKCYDCNEREKENLNEAEKILSILTKEDWSFILRSIQIAIASSINKQKEQQK